MSKTTEVVLGKWIEKRGQLMGWMTGGGVLGSAISFLVGFLMGLAGIPLFGNNDHREAVLPWLLMWVLGYNIGVLANRAFDCSANASCVPNPAGPFGGGGGGGW